VLVCVCAFSLYVCESVCKCVHFCVRVLEYVYARMGISICTHIMYEYKYICIHVKIYIYVYI